MATAPPKQRNWHWRSKAFRGVLYQVLAITLIFVADKSGEPPGHISNT